MQYKMPDITPAQIVAVVGAIIGVLVSSGVDMTQQLQDAILNLVTILSSALVVGDAVVRHGRSRALAPPPVVMTPPADGGPLA